MLESSEGVGEGVLSIGGSTSIRSAGEGVLGAGEGVVEPAEDVLRVESVVGVGEGVLRTGDIVLSDGEGVLSRGDGCSREWCRDTSFSSFALRMGSAVGLSSNPSITSSSINLMRLALGMPSSPTSSLPFRATPTIDGTTSMSWTALLEMARGD